MTTIFFSIKTKPVLLLNILFSLFLGVILFLGGVKKFQAAPAQPTDLIRQYESGKLDTNNVALLKLRNYTFGMKQTGYFWQFLGATELVAAALVLSQVFTLLGAVFALPITINIFLFHVFLEPKDVGELVETGLLLLANLWLIGYYYPRWKSLLWINSFA